MDQLLISFSSKAKGNVLNVKICTVNDIFWYCHVCLMLLPFIIITDSFSAELKVRDALKLSTVVDETSGLASHGNFIYTINDSGNSNSLHKLSREGEILDSILISNAENIDWESLAQDEKYLYIADTGNNLNRRNRFTIYRVPWSELDNLEVEAELIKFSYGDYIPGRVTRHNFDAEAISIRDDEIWLFSKNRGDRNSRLYRFPKEPGTYQPMPSQSFSVNSLVTGADIDPSTGDLLLTSTRRDGFRWKSFIWLAPTSDDGVIWDKRRSAVVSPADQWEAVLWDAQRGEIILSHENNVQGYAGVGKISISNFME